MTTTVRTNPLLNSQPKVETAGLFPHMPETSKLVDAVCQEHGVKRTIRVRADLESRVVNPLLRNPGIIPR